jgi:chromosome partitioning protein
VTKFNTKLQRITEELREQILAPQPRKNPPTFTSSQVASMCGIDRNRFNYLASKEGSTLPGGEGQGNRRSRVYSLAETREWIRQVADIPKTPLERMGVGAAKILISCNLKGGSCKTTTAMNLAQGLTLLNRKVLIIDVDPQASITELCGMYAEKEIGEDDTVLPYIYDQDFELKSVVRPTYWDGIDLIAAHPNLFSAEFKIPSMIAEGAEGFVFWRLLRSGLDPLRTDYDYIIIDSAPSLSYLTINALLAADAIIMPLVPESLDFMSSVSFWSLFSDLATSFVDLGEDKTYDFITVLLSKVENGPTSSASVVKSWAQRAYSDWLHTIEIPSSSVASSSSLALSTVFDMSKGDAAERSLARVRDPMMAFCQWVDEQYYEHWRSA